MLKSITHIYILSRQTDHGFSTPAKTFKKDIFIKKAGRTYKNEGEKSKCFFRCYIFVTESSVPRLPIGVLYISEE